MYSWGERLDRWIQRHLTAVLGVLWGCALVLVAIDVLLGNA